MPAHVPFQCPDPCPRPGVCTWCDGGLFACTVCGGMEGSLLPECPGRRLTLEEDQANYQHYCNQTGPFAVPSPNTD